MPRIAKKYKYAVIAVDVVIFRINKEKLEVLLIQMKKRPFSGSWAAPGGLIKANEALDQAAKRILFEKSGVKNVFLEQLYAFGKVSRDPFGRVVSVAYYALIPGSDLPLKTTKEYSDVRWSSLDRLPRLAYDHREIIEKAVRRLQKKLVQSNVAYSLLPKEFTLSQLQKTYEIILRKKLDKRNFQKKIFSLNLIKKTDRKQRGAANRPANLYRFAVRKPKKFEII